MRFSGGVRGGETRMPKRKYSIEEIDRMREAVELMQPDGVYNEREEERRIERELRTYMRNGTDPAELEGCAQQRLEENMRDEEAMERRRQESLASLPAENPRRSLLGRAVDWLLVREGNG